MSCIDVSAPHIKSCPSVMVATVSIANVLLLLPPCISQYFKGSDTDQGTPPSPGSEEEHTEESNFGDNWDLYLTAVLCVLLVVVIRWRRR